MSSENVPSNCPKCGRETTVHRLKLHTVDIKAVLPVLRKGPNTSFTGPDVSDCCVETDGVDCLRRQLAFERRVSERVIELARCGHQESRLPCYVDCQRRYFNDAACPGGLRAALEAEVRS